MPLIGSNESTASPHRASPYAAWTETLAVTLLGPLIGYWSRPLDPFFMHTEFAWLAVGPLLAGLRYGFAHGFSSALLLITALTYAWQQRWLGEIQSPREMAVGVLLIGMIAGEFSNTWQRRIEQLAASNAYREERLDELARAFSLLKLSHEGLEQRLAASATSLRDCILSVRRQLLQVTSEAGSLFGLAPLITRLFVTYGALQVASLHEVGRDGRALSNPIARYGSDVTVDPEDPLLEEALRTGKALSIKADAPSDAGLSEELLMAVPIIDIADRIWAVLAVHKMPFRAFRKENLTLLAVIGGHMGDALAAREQVPEARDGDHQDFLLQLRRCLADARRYRLPAHVAALVLPTKEGLPGLLSLLLGQRRGLDQPLVIENALGWPTLFMLLPLTDSGGLAGYRQRLTATLKEHFGYETLEAAGIAFHGHPITPTSSLQTVLEPLCKACTVAPGGLLGENTHGHRAVVA
ncbi:MAG: PelD GGDEF domain-containing protein [Gammaproteobacteria bacterium]